MFRDTIIGNKAKKKSKGLVNREFRTVVTSRRKEEIQSAGPHRKLLSFGNVLFPGPGSK